VCALAASWGGAPLLAQTQQTARLRGFDAADGHSYYAVSFQGTKSAVGRGPQRIVVLVDTSASQIGEHRTRGLAAARGLLESLSETDSARLLAVDVKATPLTEEFQSGPETAAKGIPLLSQRFPAGSTDLGSALESAAALIPAGSTGSLVYIGDGMSTAALLQPEELASLTKTLRERQIPVHSIALGSRTDLQLLGILAEQTGGIVVRDSESSTPAASVQKLTASLDRAISYPTTLEVNWATGALEPAIPLPLREDRSTIYLARGTRPETAQVQLGTTEWTFAADRQAPGFDFLAPLWHQARSSQGINVPLAGEELLAAAQDSFVDEVTRLEARGDQAIAAGQKQTAEQVGFTLKQLNPNNPRADRFIQGAGLTLAQAEAVPPPAPGIGVDPLNSRQAPTGQSAISDVENARRAREQKLAAEVDRGIGDARKIGETDPSGAISYLEQLLATVKASTDIDKGAYDRLVSRVRSSLQDARNRLEVREQAAQATGRREIELERQRSLSRLVRRRDAETERLVDRIRALMAEGYAGHPAAFGEGEVIARQIESEKPGSALGAALVFTTEAAGQIDAAERLRQLRYDRVLDVLYQAELAHVPFPDEPPVRYPPAEVWQALTQRRAKWKSVDLHRNSPNEERISQALAAQTELEFPDNTLKEVIDYLAQIHNIPIKFDPAVTDAGVNPEEAKVSLTLSGITLRSALKIMLENIEGTALTYVIEDEIMKITTVDAANEKRSTRVYPVADIVITLTPLGGGFGGGALGGGQGQQGGGLGNQQGGQGGGGGGFGGGGQGGGGGGFFSIPAGR